MSGDYYNDSKQNLGQSVGHDGGVGHDSAGAMQGAPPMPPHAGGMPPYTSKFLTWSFTFGLIPPLALLFALATKTTLLLDYVHVFTGGAWVGFDIFGVLVLEKILGSLEPPIVPEVVKRLTLLQTILFVSISATAIFSGVYLSQRLGIFNLHDPWFLASAIIVLALIVVGYGILGPLSLQLFLELVKTRPDFNRIGRISGTFNTTAKISTILLVVLIFIMAHFRMG